MTPTPWRRSPKLRQRIERGIEEACTQFLELDGWRCIKTDLPHLRGLGVQEKGMADRLYVRYLDPADFEEREKKRWAEVLWVEWKAPKGKAKPHQINWHIAERSRGALTLIGGVDFPAGIEGFQDWYFASGLARRVRK